MRWLLAATHLLALGIGLGVVWARGRALRGPLDLAGLRRVDHLFVTKLGLLVMILALEVAPMAALIRWRAAVGKGPLPDTSRAPRFAGISTLQAVLVVLMVVAATGMARGYGSPSP